MGLQPIRYVDKMSTDKMQVTPIMQNTEETIALYANDTNLFQLGSTNPKKKLPKKKKMLIRKF